MRVVDQEKRHGSKTVPGIQAAATKAKPHRQECLCYWVMPLRTAKRMRTENDKEGRRRFQRANLEHRAMNR